MRLLDRLRGAPAARLAPRAGDAPVSVVVPLYQHARYVAAALASALAQTAPPREILVIDDGSRDDGAAIAARALRGVAGARVLRQDNRGAAETINAAVAQAAGDWIAVLNSDDQFAPDKLARCQLVMAAQPDATLIAGGIALVDAAGRRLQRGVSADWLRRAHDFAGRAAHPPLALLNENFVATTSNMVFTRALWRQLGGFAPLRYCHDLDFLLRAFACAHVAIDAEAVHVLYRVHEANTIAEDVRGVRVELAAVIAEAMASLGPRLLPQDDDAGFALFREFLRNKAVSEAVLYFTALRGRFADAHAFYRHVTAEPQRTRFLEMV
ncbi:MAG: glycosyltransferase [Rhodospirillales bacterium]|nr:glycosyltransferase [Rhodospirillales bacterium]